MQSRRQTGQQMLRSGKRCLHSRRSLACQRHMLAATTTPPRPRPAALRHDVIAVPCALRGAVVRSRGRAEPTDPWAISPSHQPGAASRAEDSASATACRRAMCASRMAREMDPRSAVATTASLLTRASQYAERMRSMPTTHSEGASGAGGCGATGSCACDRQGGGGSGCAGAGGSGGAAGGGASGGDGGRACVCCCSCINCDGCGRVGDGGR